ncbi:MAG: hypothetical protein QOK26_3601, partial [Pseudonocardiales bacterium]|nr:hypothetical protein [Pseudonocardiales bacterium]
RAFEQRALTADEIFDTVCEKIIDTVIMTAVERGGSTSPGAARKAADTRAEAAKATA